jgi:hypothetical protein
MKGAAMADTSKGALDLLEDLRKERDELDSLIRGLERRLGVTHGNDQHEIMAATARAKQAEKAIPLGFFHNMTQADATEKLLRLNPNQPLATKDILDALRKSGMQVNPRNAITILYTTLKRSPRFERVAGKAWGLNEWYSDKKRKREEPQDANE